MSKHYQDFEFDGVHVEGVSYCLWRWGEYKLPTDLSGLTVLDIGSWDGFFAMESKRLGAKEVTAIDLDAWLKPGIYQEFQDNLKRFHFDVKHEVKDVCSLDASFGQFDLVLFLQVLYHMTNPVGAIQAAASVCKKWLWIETVILGEDSEEKSFWMIPRDGMAPVFHPSRKAVEYLIQWVGFDAELVTEWIDPGRDELPGVKVRRMAWKCTRR